MYASIYATHLRASRCDVPLAESEVSLSLPLQTGGDHHENSSFPKGDFS
jgi:hypothetical protein